MNSLNFNIIICIKDALPEVQKCIKSISKNTSGNYKLILVNDFSNIKTSKYLNSYVKEGNNSILINNPKNLGYTKSLNKGIKKADSELIIVLNSDIIVTPDWDKKLLNPLINNINIGIVSPISNAALWQSVPEVFDKKGKYKINALPWGNKLEKFSSLIESQFKNQQIEVELLNGFCMATRKSILDKIGFFDEINFPVGYGEETDFCIKVSELGYKLIIKPDTYLYHFKSKSFGHEQRIKLAATGKNSLFKLYGQERISKLNSDMQNHSGLLNIRSIIKHELYNQ